MHHPFARSAENIAIVSADQKVSIARRSQEIELSYGTLWRILHLVLYLHQYKIQLTQQLRILKYWKRGHYSHCLVRSLVCRDCNRQFGALWAYDNRIFFFCY